MTSIRYVCLSDLHLGEEDSLLTDPDDLTRPSPVLQHLAECLAEVLRHNPTGAPKPNLILAGDVLELALGPIEQALTAFEPFLRSVMPPGNELFGEIIYLPGNHDHHMWQAAREAQYLGYLKRLAPTASLEAPWDTTKVMMDQRGEDRLVCGAATLVAQRLPNLRDRRFEILSAYPNFGVQNGSGRAVVFHHGHFIEDAYHFFSTLACLMFPGQCLPVDVYTLEKENSAWIDLMWSTLGSAGRIGGDVEAFYEATKDPDGLKRVTDNLAKSVAAKYPVPKWAPRFLREYTLRAALHEGVKSITGEQERRQVEGEKPLSEAAARGLRAYVEDLLRRQFETEKVPQPASLSFVLGHTHKPFVERWDNGTNILNTGGWVVDAPEMQPLHGAAAVLIAEDLSTLSIRWYNEGRYHTTVEEPLAPGSSHSSFFNEIDALLHERPQPWRAFGESAKAEVSRRAIAFAERLKRRAAARK